MPDSGITKKALAQAIKDLMAEVSFSKITVGDICDKCQMNRKSFYYHFRDKYDLVNWIYYTEFVETVHGNSYESGWDLFEDICRYLYNNRSFYVKALEISGQNSFRGYFSEVLEPIIMTYLEEDFPAGKDRSFFAEFFTDAFLISIEKWLSRDSSLPPKEYVALLKKAASGVTSMIITHEAD